MVSIYCTISKKWISRSNVISFDITAFEALDLFTKRVHTSLQVYVQIGLNTQVVLVLEVTQDMTKTYCSKIYLIEISWSEQIERNH